MENPKNTLIEVNKNLVKSEDQRIEDFISRYHWQMKKTGTGLRYMIYKQGDGEEAEIGRIVRFEYTVSLLSGEDCYTSDDLGPKEFLIGKGGVESGLEEAILLLKKGDRAKFILPSHLAFGLPGDGNKIPSKAAIVYDVNLLEVL
ncbi:MAG: FKBP-type peptidyl-prolyl cis-trans isomerase [Bacteroidales bacterium]|nr:FKBP-type peptidyl-prolyl cis-trans isomerase [Bacteroidales bacterium]